MGMDFFGHQEQARKASKRLVWLYVAAVVCIILLIYGAALGLLVGTAKRRTVAEPVGARRGSPRADRCWTTSLSVTAGATSTGAPDAGNASSSLPASCPSAAPGGSKGSTAAVPCSIFVPNSIRKATL